MASGTGITVTRVGTAVVVRLDGAIGAEHAEALREALDDVARLVSRRVTVDLSGLHHVEGPGLEFLAELGGRWQVRHLHTPHHLRGLRSTLGPGAT